jgi:hypothetical protein
VAAAGWTMTLHEFEGVPTRLGRVARAQLLMRAIKWVARLEPLRRSRMSPYRRS